MDRGIFGEVFIDSDKRFFLCVSKHEFQAVQLLSNSLSSVSLAQSVACQFAIVRHAIPRSNLLGTRI